MIIVSSIAAFTLIILLLVAMLLFAPLLFALLQQLVAVGKMEPHEMQSAAIVLGGGLACSALWMTIKYITQLGPERRHLDALLSQYEDSLSAD